MIGTIVVELYFYIRLGQFASTRQTELDVSDVETTCQPHRFVVGLNAQQSSVENGKLRLLVTIQVFCLVVNRQAVVLHHATGVGEKEVGVGLQMNRAAVDQKVPIALHEIS